MKLIFYKSILIPVLLLVITIASYGQCENDTQLPSAICNDKLTITLENSSFTLNYNLINESSSDNCTLAENLDFKLRDDNNQLGDTVLVYEQPGQYTVILTVTDEAGNSNKCWSIVSVLNSPQECAVDKEAPQLTCLDLQTIHIGPIFALDFIRTIYDNCASEENISYGLELVTDFTGSMPAESFIDFTVPGLYTVYVWATDLNGNSTYCKTKILINETMLVSGTIYHDENNNCTKEAGEAGLEQSVKITLVEVDGATYTITEESVNGIYTVHIPKPQSATAQVEVSLVNENLTSCKTLFTDEIAANQTELEIEDIGIHLTAGCADLGVTVEAIDGNCQQEGLYIIRFYNGGDQPALPHINLDFSNTVLFNPDRIFFSHTISMVSVGNNHAFLFLNNLLPGQEGSIFLFGKQDCDFDNQTQVITATIDAENACSNNWTGPELNIYQKCQGEEVEFTITNSGKETMESPSKFVVIEDVIMLRERSIQLAAGASETLKIPANGATYHLQVQQAIDYPWQKTITAVSEGCATNSANITTGLVAQLPLDNSAPHIDIAVLENKTTTYNTINSLPIGVGSEHLIAANTPIEYVIEYSNEQDVIADALHIEVELSTHLDRESLKTIYSSETSFTVTEKGTNLVIFSFPRIDLVPNNINEKESAGILKFTINQKADVLPDTKIESKVTIQFNDSTTITDRVFHTVGDLNLSTAIEDLLIAPIGLSVYPNPFSYSTTFEFEKEANTQLSFELYTAKGQLIQKQVLNTQKFDFHRRALNKGLYFYVFKEAGKLVSSGKLLVD